MSTGKLKKTLKQKCPECRRVNLTIRTSQVQVMIDGEMVFEDRDHIACPHCEYTEPVEKKRYRREKIYGYSQ